MRWSTVNLFEVDMRMNKEKVQGTKMMRYMVRYSPIEMVVALASLNWTLHTSVVKFTMT